MWLMLRGLRVAVLVVVALALTAAPASAATYDFSVTPELPKVGEQVTFQLQGSSEEIERVRWDLDGDGGFDDGRETQVTHAYGAPGPVTVRMRVIEEDGGKPVVVAKTITVNSTPTVDFGFSPRSPVTGEEVAFSEAVSDADGDAVALAWDFGDGTGATGSAPRHSYAAAGTYTVGLTATDAHGVAATAFRTLEVTRPAARGVVPLRRMRPFPVVRIAGLVLPNGARVRILSVRGPVGARLRVRCRGRGCPARAVAKTSAARLVRFGRFERKLRAGVRLQIFVRKPGRIGKYTRFRIRAGEPPARVDRCLLPGRARPVRCP
jgi:PKD repeat protein